MFSPVREFQIESQHLRGLQERCSGIHILNLHKNRQQNCALHRSIPPIQRRPVQVRYGDDDNIWFTDGVDDSIWKSGEAASSDV